MTRLFVALHLRVLEIMTAERREERGQGTLEYVGMIAVAAIIVLAVLTATKTVKLDKFFTDQVEKITNFK